MERRELKILSLNTAFALLILIGFSLIGMTSNVQAQSDVVEDFEDYLKGEIPRHWKFLNDKKLVAVTPEIMSPEIYFKVMEEGGNSFLRVHVKDRYHRILLENKKDFNWSIKSQPILEWDWRAVQLPKGANELKGSKNDTGGAVYVYFKKKDFFGRPRTIKYTYSSSQSIGSTKRYGALKLIVVSSETSGDKDWVHIRRNVAEDYKRLFGETLKDDPLLLALWSDSDNMDDTAIVDFDNIKLSR